MDESTIGAPEGDLVWRRIFGFDEGEPSVVDPIDQTHPDRGLRFTKESARLGIHPVRYVHSLDNDFPLHTHEFFEIVFVLKGKGGHLVEDHRFPLSEGEIVFVDNRNRHTLRAEGAAMEILNLCFLPSSLGIDPTHLKGDREADFYEFLRPFRSVDASFEPVTVRPDARTRDRILFHVEHMRTLIAERDPACDGSIRDLMRVTLSLLFREFQRKYSRSPEGPGPMAEVARYLRVHAGEPITMEDLARRLDVSRSYFSTLFNRTFGKSFPSYLNELRIRKARDLLEKTDLPSSRIAEESGFATRSHFHRAFRKLVGETPEEYRTSRPPTQRNRKK